MPEGLGCPQILNKASSIVREREGSGVVEVSFVKDETVWKEEDCMN